MYVGSGDPNPGPHTYTASTLPLELFPQPLWPRLECFVIRSAGGPQAWVLEMILKGRESRASVTPQCCMLLWSLQSL